jgi:hypothetical protein
VEQLAAAKTLPPREAFHTKVANEGISEANYSHAQTVFSTFGCKNMLAYCELYCGLDVILLAECFTSFRNEVLEEVGLDCW